MNPEDKKALWAEFKRLGVPGVKAKIRGRSSTVDLHKAQTWLDEQEESGSKLTRRLAVIAIIISLLSILAHLVK